MRGERLVDDGTIPGRRDGFLFTSRSLDPQILGLLHRTKSLLGSISESGTCLQIRDIRYLPLILIGVENINVIVVH